MGGAGRSGVAGRRRRRHIRSPDCQSACTSAPPLCSPRSSRRPSNLTGQPALDDQHLQPPRTTQGKKRSRTPAKRSLQILALLTPNCTQHESMHCRLVTFEKTVEQVVRMTGNVCE